MGYKLNKSISISEIADSLGLPWRGVNVVIQGVSAVDEAGMADLAFSRSLPAGLSGVGLISSEVQSESNVGQNGFVLSENPRLDFIRALNLLESDIGFSTWKRSAEIHPTAKVGQNVIIEEGCIIGAGAVIEHNVVLHAGTRIGVDSRIRSCSSIGSDGFGFERLSDGTPLRFPHLGGVVIGDNVEVGACTAVARGTLSDTVIEDNVKIDNLVHVAHNCLIKNGAFIIACAELSGGVVVGKNAWVAPNSCTHQKIMIGEGSLIGLGAVVTKNVQDMCVYAGNPAKKIRSLK